MLIAAINIPQFDKHNIILSNKTNNNIVEQGFFYRIYYSDRYYTSNGIYILLKLKNINVEKYFNKIKCIFPIIGNESVIKQIKKIEEQILNHFDLKKRKRYKISEQLNSRFIKIICEKNKDWGYRPYINLALKFSGIWESETEYGITFRFYIIHSQL
tara:strand:- start:815 stop:1285 length:471 start_codon:yes stop_codon:yes gene_type:complete